MCNCKSGKKQIMNNLDSPDHIIVAKEMYNSVILKKTIEEFDEIDLMEIRQVYLSLYPNSKGTPSVENMIEEIKVGIELYNTKYGRR